MEIHGILSIEETDRQTDILVTAGADITRLPGSRLVYEFAGPPVNPIGKVRAAKAILRWDDVANTHDHQLWELAGGVPFIAVFARLNPVLPMSRPIKDLLEAGSPVFFGAGGSVLERVGSRLTRTVLREVALTLAPVNRKHQVFKSRPLSGVPVTTSGTIGMPA